MTSTKQFKIHSLYLVLVTALSVLSSGAGLAATSPAPDGEAAKQQQLQELDEITVRGKYTANMIIDAEDKFFALYNKLDKEYDYHIHCGLASSAPGSMIMRRVCVPNFITDAMDMYVGAPASPRLICAGDFSTSAYGNSTTGPCMDGGYEPPPVALLLMDRQERWHRHMLKVVKSDPRLDAMADHLGGLHYEMASLQSSYIKVKNRNRKPARFNPNAGPRTL